MNSAPPRIPQGWYHPAPCGKLRAIAAFGLLNGVVRSAEANRLTGGACDLTSLMPCSTLARSG